MVSGSSSIQIKVPDLEQALTDYEQLLGPFTHQRRTATLPLFNVSIEVLEDRSEDAATIAGLRLWSESEREPLPTDCRGLSLTASPTRTVSDTPTATGIRGVDHLVLRTTDADDCIRLFGGDLGMRLALDQTVAEFGGRMLFFRSGKLTLEVIQSDDPPAHDYFWGITYLCENLTETLGALDEAGVQHSAERLGRKPGTRVATVKSHCLGIPTLLIGPETQ
jgi:catechol 2,3-dioxygenase-like lactoylglutathione lyase family enzyme